MQFPPDARRVALVIGNDAYSNSPLRNAGHDAVDIAAKLDQLSFEVTLKTNLDLPGMLKALDGFARSLKAGDVSLFYFSGHGMQVNGENFLIPLGFGAKDESDIPYASLGVSRVQELMEKSGTGLHFIILDACRNNPMRPEVNGQVGLATMHSNPGTFIALAASPNQMSSDNPSGKNGLFTGYLLQALNQPGLKIGQLFDSVRQMVSEESRGAQTPWTGSSLPVEFVFNDPALEKIRLEKLKAERKRLDERIASADSATQPVAGVRPPRAGEVKRNDRDGLNYVFVPAGEFSMGCAEGCNPNEMPGHTVKIGTGFWIGQSEVTQAAYRKIMGTLPGAFRGDLFPVDSVTWDEATAYCGKLGARLPSEAEWEYAAGEPSGPSAETAVFGLGAGSLPQRVAQKQPNSFGLYDMLGNVWEWTAFGEYEYPSGAELDRRGPNGPGRRVLRGGSVWDLAENLRVSLRYVEQVNVRYGNIGFRCVMDDAAASAAKQTSH